MASVLACLVVLDADVAPRRAKLPFILDALRNNRWELELDARAAETAASIRASSLGKLFSRLSDMAQSPVGADRDDAALVLHTCMAAGCCGEKALDAFGKQWLGSAAALLTLRNSWEARGRACAIIAFVLHAVHAIGKDSHAGREATATIAGLMVHVVRVLEGEAAAGDAPAPASTPARHADPNVVSAAVAQCLELWRALLVFSPQVVRSHAHKLTARCLQELDSPCAELSTACQQVLALLAHQVRCRVVRLLCTPPCSPYRVLTHLYSHGHVVRRLVSAVVTVSHCDVLT